MVEKPFITVTVSRSELLSVLLFNLKMEESYKKDDSTTAGKYLRRAVEISQIISDLPNSK